MIDVGFTEYFACDECPIISQLDYRLSIAGEYGFQFDHCGCDKVYDEFFWCGYCEDAWVNKPDKKWNGSRSTGRAFRRKMKRHKLKKLIESVSNCPSYGVWPSAGFGKNEGGQYIMRRKNSVTEQFYKNYSNRAVRRANGYIPKGNSYRKLFDYWWTIA